MVIACNTAHLLLPELEKQSGRAFVSLIGTTINAARARHIQKVGLMASPTTLKTKLYANALAAEGIDILVPTTKEQQVIERVIRSVIAGKNPKGSTMVLQHIVRHMQLQGAQSVILGCTELSVVFAGVKDPFLLDPLDEVTTELLVASND